MSNHIVFRMATSYLVVLNSNLIIFSMVALNVVMLSLISCGKAFYLSLSQMEVSYDPIAFDVGTYEMVQFALTLVISNRDAINLI